MLNGETIPIDIFSPTNKSGSLSPSAIYFCTFIDYSKAFDTVWRDALWYKMAKVGIKGKFMTIVKNMYESVKSCVFMNGMKSESFISLVGVRQGENLSPLLFSSFISGTRRVVRPPRHNGSGYRSSYCFIGG